MTDITDFVRDELARSARQARLTMRLSEVHRRIERETSGVAQRGRFKISRDVYDDLKAMAEEEKTVDRAIPPRNALLGVPVDVVEEFEPDTLEWHMVVRG